MSSVPRISRKAQIRIGGRPEDVRRHGDTFYQDLKQCWRLATRAAVTTRRSPERWLEPRALCFRRTIRRGGEGGGISGGGWCPAQPWKLAPPGACPSGTAWGCDYAQERCACYGETDPSGCCDYYDGNCLNVGPPGYPGGGGGGPVGGPSHHGPVVF